MPRKNTRNTRGRIIAAAWKLFYEQGYEDTTVEDILALSGTSKGTFYHYFEGKDALLGTLSVLFDDKYEELVEKINRVKEILFHKDNLMVDFTGSKDGFKFIYEKAAEFKNNLSSEKGERDNWVFKPENKNEGFKTAY